MKIQKEHLAIASVPVQSWGELYNQDDALKTGTIFKELDLPFFAAEQIRASEFYPLTMDCMEGILRPHAISQYGGPDGVLSASMRYLSQRYTMPLKAVGSLLTDIGEVKAAGFDAYYIDHTAGMWPQGASSIPFTAKEFQS